MTINAGHANYGGANPDPDAHVHVHEDEPGARGLPGDYVREMFARWDDAETQIDMCNAAKKALLAKCRAEVGTIHTQTLKLAFKIARSMRDDPKKLEKKDFVEGKAREYVALILDDMEGDPQ